MSKPYYKYLLRHFLYWTPVFTLFTLFRQAGHETIKAVDVPEMSIAQYAFFQLVIGITAGLLFGSINYSLDKYIARRVPFGKTVLIGSLSYLTGVLLMVSLGFVAYLTLQGVPLTPQLFATYFFSVEMLLIMLYNFIAGAIFDFVKEVDKKFGPGNLWKMVMGEFYQPKEDERIFMFLDLKSSTTIAEKLGHEAYSNLIQRCFHDVSGLVVQYQASVYQYVGDEIVLSWRVEEGLNNLNCLRFFFGYQQMLFRNKAYYEARFGLLPQFKAGLEMGSVMVAEVGDIKREIAFHGDVLNTAARIQALCNQYGKMILVSERIEQAIKQNIKGRAELMGNLQLRGKQKYVKVYAIEAPQLVVAS